MSSYADLLNVVKAYYGESDIFNAMVESGGTGAAVRTADFAKAMQQIPGVNVVKNNAGEILYYEYGSTSYLPKTAATSLAQAANSNVAGATAAAQTGSAAVKTPVNIKAATTAAGETVTTAGSGLSKVGSSLASTGQFVANSVVPAIAAAGVGIKLGKWIDSTLYNLNPDFWNANNMSTLNPETWNSITSPGDGISSALFNVMFDLNTDTGLTQPYLDETAFAYILNYMLQQGVFAAGESTVVETKAADGTILTPVDPFYPAKKEWTINYTVNGNNYHVDIHCNVPVGVFQNYYYNNELIVLVPSDVNGTSFLMTYEDTGKAWTPDWSGTVTGLYNNHGKVCGAATSTFSIGSDVGATSSNISVSGASAKGNRDTATNTYLLLYGNTQGGGGVEGIPDQDGASVFDPSGLPANPSIQDLLDELQNQYPDLFADAVVNTVADPDTGETKDIYYLPIGYPEIDPDNPNQPTATTSTQDDSAYDPDEYPDIADQIAQLITYITRPNPDTGEDEMVDDPNPPTNTPDTGSGKTPAITPPTGSASALFAVYNPTQAQVNAFGAWLWSSSFVDQIKKIFNDPMESIISLHKIFGTPTTGGAQNIQVGYLDSGVSSAVITSQYCEVNCGTVTLSEYFGNVFDYKHTAIELYLPFVGIVPLNIDDVMRASVTVKYKIDVLTGACLAEINVIRDGGNGGVLYQYAGDCAIHYPVSSASYMGLVGGLLSIAAGVTGTIATGGAAAPMILGAGAAATHAHANIGRSGGFSSNAGAMGGKIPYFIISRPQTALPTSYLSMEGIGSNETVILSQCKGYTAVKEIYLEGIGDASIEELTEIETLLKEGVIL